MPEPSAQRTATLLTRLLSLVGEEIPVGDPPPSIVRAGGANREEVRQEVAAIASELEGTFSAMVAELRTTRGSVEDLTVHLSQRMDSLERNLLSFDGDGAPEPPELVEARKALDGLREEIRQQRERTAEVEQQLEGARSEQEALSSELQEAVLRDAAHASELQAARAEQEGLRTELATTTSEFTEWIEALERERDELAGKLTEAQQERDGLADAAGAVRAEGERAEEARAAALEQIEQLQRAMKKVEADRETLGANQAELQRQLEQREGELARARTEVERARTRATEAGNQLTDDLARRAQEAEQRAQEAEQRAQEAGQRADEATATLRDAEQRAQKAEQIAAQADASAAEAASLRAELTRINAQLEDSASRLAELRASRESSEGGVTARQVALRIEGLDKQLENARKVAEDRTAQVAQAEERLAAAGEENATLAAEIERLEGLLQSRQAEADEVQVKSRERARKLQSELEQGRSAYQALVQEADAAHAEAAKLRSDLGAADQERDHLLANQQRAVDHVRRLESLLVARDEEIEELRRAPPSVDEVIELTEPALPTPSIDSAPTESSVDIQPLQPMKPPWSPETRPGAQGVGRMAIRSGTVMSARKESPKSSGLSRLFGRGKKR